MKLFLKYHFGNEQVFDGGFHTKNSYNKNIVVFHYDLCVIITHASGPHTFCCFSFYVLIQVSNSLFYVFSEYVNTKPKKSKQKKTHGQFVTPIPIETIKQ